MLDFTPQITEFSGFALISPQYTVQYLIQG